MIAGEDNLLRQASLLPAELSTRDTCSSMNQDSAIHIATKVPGTAICSAKWHLF